MTDQLEIFDLKGKSLGFQDRKNFFRAVKQEFNKTKKISKKIKSIRLLLMNSKGRVYLQKRSKLKEENPNRYDKTIGGHVIRGDSFEMTVIRECAEELGFPASILPSKEFEKAIHVTNLGVVGIIKKIDFMDTFNSVRVSSRGTKFIQPFINAMFIGYYDGAIRFIDGESSGIEVFSLKDLESDI